MLKVPADYGKRKEYPPKCEFQLLPELSCWFAAEYAANCHRGVERYQSFKKKTPIGFSFSAACQKRCAVFLLAGSQNFKSKELKLWNLYTLAGYLFCLR